MTQPTQIVVFAVALFLATIHIAMAQGISPEQRKELLKRADEWSVPQPKPNAKLLKIWAYKSETKDSPMRDYFALGFVDPSDSKRALVGLENWNLTGKLKTVAVADVEKLSLNDIAVSSPFGEPNGTNFGLVTGIQLLRRGNEKIGTALIDRSLAAESGHPRSLFFSPAGEPPILMLARSCLAAAINEITSLKPDFARIKQGIERLVADQPQLAESTRAILDSLKENIEHQQPPAGTVERIVDDWLLSEGTCGAMTFNVDKASDAERALILQGFKAVPALLHERHSHRFSNHLMQGFNNFVSYPMTVGQVADGYLQRLANNEFDTDWLERQKGYTAKDDALEAWWKEASVIGEEEYVKKHTVALAPDNKCRVGRELLLLAQERYPTFLPDFYRTMLRTSEVSWPVAEALVDCKEVLRDQKIKLFQDGIATKSDAHRNTALYSLQKVDSVVADEALVTLLNNAPKTAKGEYWTDQDAGLGNLVSGSRDFKVWKALHALIDRADLGMRMELIENLDPPRDAPAEILQSYQEIYAKFRDDTTVRDVSSSDKFSGPGAGFPHDRIEMRDFIHSHWARWLELGMAAPDEGATPAQWKAYREAVERGISKYEAEQRARGLAKPLTKP